MNYQDIKVRIDTILTTYDRRMKLIDILFRFHDAVKRAGSLDGAPCFYHPGDFVDEIDALYDANREV
jgi:hypothetical protein